MMPFRMRKIKTGEREQSQNADRAVANTKTELDD